jgi:hypothetical protein
MHQVLHAANFAAEKHKKQKRKDAEGTPYINHPLAVAMFITNSGVDDLATIQAAILHDTVEDTDTSLEELEKEFGQEVAGIVKECSDDKSLAKDVRKKMQIEHAAAASHKAKLVKLADKLHNLSSLLISPPSFWDAERIQGYFCWSHIVVEACKGTNEILEEQLNNVFADTFTLGGITYPTLVPEEQRVEFLEKYYASMRAVND